jgi:dTMP kinase
LRNLLLGGEVAWAPLAEVFLHFAARAEHVGKTILPALADGKWVICDRFFDSTMVYQGFALGGDRGKIGQLAAMIDAQPDLTIVLDVPVEISVERLAARGMAADRYERLGADFFARVRAGFLEIARAAPERCVVLDGVRTEELLGAAILGEVDSRFPP